MSSSRSLISAAKLVGLLAVIGAAIYFYAPLRLSAYVLLGRSPECPWRQAVRSADNLADQIRAKDEILKASKKVQTDEQGYSLFDTPMGRYWMPKGSDYVLPFNLAEEKRKIYGEGPRKGDVVLDCGANVGVFTRVALNNGAKTVVAIEPAPENIECLRRNFTTDIASGRVIIYPKGVWDKEETLTLKVDPENSAADSFVITREKSHEVLKIPVTTIDKLVSELNLPSVDYIKMDIEGAEPNALRGGRATISKHHPRMALSVYHQADHPVTVPRLAKEAYPGYRVECGPCAEANYAVRPDILYFRP